MSRRLAAILSADVVGYSRLMAEDEEGTLAALKAHRHELFDPTTEQHEGRIVKLMGDGVLVEFPSVSNAVDCALAIQRTLAEAAGSIRLRVGINLGDVILDEADIYGEGVNIAARLEGLSDPGGICISEIVHQSLGKRLAGQFIDSGRHQVKGLDTPLRAWKWSSDATAASSPKPLALPDKPSIAVLPFNNMSNDPEQEFFSDGISEDVITELSKFRTLFVISRNSSFAFKGQQLSASQIGETLGVRYMLEGSVRRAGNRVRITAQLIDTLDDAHLWAERYDRSIDDIFDVQDEVVHAIVNAIEPELISTEQQRALRKTPDSLDVWENYQRALWHIHQYLPEQLELGLGFMRKAIALDPTFSQAHAGIGFAQYVYVLMTGNDRDERLAEGLRESQVAINLDANDPFGYVALGRINTILGRHEAAIDAYDQALSLNPSFATAHFGKGHALWHSGCPGEAIARADEAMRLSPRDPLIWAYLASKGIALVMLERYEEAIACAQSAQRKRNPAIFAHVAEVSALHYLGRAEEAKAAIARMLEVKPDATMRFLEEALPITDQRCADHFFGGLRGAGVPE
ncbi:MAG: adenylate/guanylate cyclase domain-containing protein [Pseudomonadota bacterium]